MRRLRFAVAAIITVANIQSAHAEPWATPSVATCRGHAPEAATRSGLAVDVILRVMQAESGGSPNVVSIKGAIGCMQIMSATWTYLSRRYSLGGDPYDAQMNMIGGALYLAELARRFGWPGAYAAYNAGPTRYIRYAADGLPLPAETVAYAARLGGAAAPAIAAIPRARWQEARLFLDRNDAAGDTGTTRALRLAIVQEETGASRASASMPPTPRVVSTLFPLSAKATPARQ